MSKKIKGIFVALASIFMIACFFVTPFKGLDQTGMRYLGIFVWWMVMMIAELIPTFLSCVAALAIAIGTGITTITTAFSAFSDSTCWLLIGALGMAAGLSNSGLLNRLALLVMKLFPGTYKGQIWAMSIASMVVAPTVPSTTAKSSILMPVCSTICDELGYEAHSEGARGLLSCTNSVTNCCGPMFMTGGIVPAMMLALYSGNISWLGYLKLALIWGLVVFFGLVLFHLFYFNPDKGVKKSEVKVLDKAVIQKRLDEMGKMGKKEITALCVLIGTIILWITESFHGIPTAVVAIAAWVILFAFGLFSVPELSSRMMWPVWVMVGGSLGVVNLLQTTGVADWIGNLVAPVISNVAGSPFLVVIGCSVLSSALMMGMVNYLITAALCISLLSSAAMDPICILFAVCISGMIYVLAPQNVPLFAAESMSGGKIDHHDMVPSSIAFIVVNLIGMALSVPWWKILGFIY